MCWRRCTTVPRTTEKRTVLFAPTKFANDTKGRFYNCVAKSLAIQFYFRSAMTDVLSHVRDGVNEARRLLPIKS